MNEGAALRAAIQAAPADDTPRLVYADWLDEQGGEENTSQAGFIRQKYPPPLRGRNKVVLGWQKHAESMLKGVAPKSWQVWVVETPGSDAWLRAVSNPQHANQTWAARMSPAHFNCHAPPFVVCLRHGFISGPASRAVRIDS